MVGDVAGIPDGSGSLSVFTNEHGGIIDDTGGAGRGGGLTAGVALRPGADAPLRMQPQAVAGSCRGCCGRPSSRHLSSPPLPTPQ